MDGEISIEPALTMTIPGKATTDSDQSDQSFRSMTKTGPITLESVVAFDRNQWSLSIGMSGRLSPEYTFRECHPRNGPVRSAGGLTQDDELG